MIRRPPRSTLFPYNDALPIYTEAGRLLREAKRTEFVELVESGALVGDDKFQPAVEVQRVRERALREDRKSTRLNSSHLGISYAVFCLKKKKKKHHKVIATDII